MRALTAMALTLTLASTAAWADSVDYGATNNSTRITTQSATPLAPKPHTNANNTRIPSAGEVGTDIGEGASTAAKTVGEGATAIGHGARDAAKAIGHGTRDFFHGFGNGWSKGN